MAGNNFAVNSDLLVTLTSVLDAAGNPVAGAVVTLNVQTIGFRKGIWTIQNVGGSQVWSIAGNVTATCFEGVGGAVTVPNVAVVSPGTVTTDSTGAATFNVVYPEDHAIWSGVLLTATTQVAGSVSTVTATFYLPQLATYITTTTSALPGEFSPYGQDAVCTDLK